MPTERFRRLEAGLYEHVGTGRLIVRTDQWEGPRGGWYSLWEFAHRDGGNLVIDATSAFRTLRDAKAHVSAASATTSATKRPDA